MTRKPWLYFHVTQDFPGNCMRVNDVIILKQWDSLIGMNIRLHGNFYTERELRKWPNIYKEITEAEYIVLKNKPKTTCHNEH